MGGHNTFLGGHVPPPRPPLGDAIEHMPTRAVPWPIFLFSSKSKYLNLIFLTIEYYHEHNEGV